MTNVQLYIAVGLPTVAVITSLVISLVQISDIRADVREIRNDLKIIVGKLGELDTRMSVIEERIK
ncbi:MAG TPA: hypothetical protein VMI06_18095 [Terriglobia bacterium]|nr:hypothetical protein [Terriglobia bacterium]